MRPISLAKKVKFRLLQSKKEGKDQELMQSSTTPDPGYQWEVTTSQLDITNESQEVSPFPAGDHMASTDVHQSITKDRNNINDPQKKAPPWNGLAIILFNNQITMALIRLSGCAGWYGPLLIANPLKQVFSHQGPHNL